ncbi:MAG: hypothetical protein Q4G34_04005 [Micrococcus sp.]|nr:hypothetical protein [Micrococcus sp.]
MSGRTSAEDVPAVLAVTKASWRETYAEVLDALSAMPAQQREAALGREPASLLVWEDNPRARAFYRREGFLELGDPVVLGGDFGDAREVLTVRDGAVAQGGGA